MEQAAKAIASSEVGGRTELSGGDGTRRFGWAKFEGALGPVLLVVAHVDAQHVSSWWREKISIRSRHSRRTVRIQRLATAFALGAVPVFG